MLFNIVLGLILPLLVVFFILAWAYRKVGIYLTGMIMANLYLLAASEGLVYVFNRKIGLGVIGVDQLLKMFVNPYKGRYRFFLLNFQYNKVILISIWVISILMLLVIIYRSRRQKVVEQQTEKLASSVNEFVDKLETDFPSSEEQVPDETLPDIDRDQDSLV